MLSNYLSFLIKGLCHSCHRSILPGTSCLYQSDIGEGVCAVYWELWDEVGVLSCCWALAPAAQHLHTLAWAAPSCNRSGLALARKHESPSSPLCFACFKQPCMQTKGIRFHVLWKLKQVGFSGVRNSWLFS